MTGNDLINTTALPAGLKEARVLARKAKAYHVLRPYPFVSFQNWKEEDRGPLPICRPFVKHIVQKGADWLFLKPVHFKVDEDDQMTELVNQVWNDNCMGSRAIEMATTGALSGAVDLKWSKPDADSDQVTIEIYDPTEHTRFYFDPTDPSKLLMARIQVPYFDYEKKKWYWKREDWTDDKWVTYDPLICREQNDQYSLNPYKFADDADKATFTGEKRNDNPFGIVPFWRVKNAASGDEWGSGDLWSFYQAVDQINFQRDLGHKGNQKRVDPAVAYIDLAQPNNEAPDFTQNPSEVQVLESTGEKEGKIQVVEGSHDILAEVKVFADELQRELYSAVGSVDLKPEEVTNKGNLTVAVMTQMYAPLVEATTRKRQLYGEDGVSVFFERMSKGLQNIGLKGWKESDVQTVWPQVIEMTEEEKTALVDRETKMVGSAFTTQERATRAIAVEDGVVDIDALVKETEPIALENKKKEDELHESQVAPPAKVSA